MGWECGDCGAINSGAADACQECRTPVASKPRPKIRPAPVSGSLIWTATVLGGALGGFAVAEWNLFTLRRRFDTSSLLYAALALAGWVLSVFFLSKMTSPFGIAFALATSLLLVSIPYNRDGLAVSQWMWAHPGRNLVISLVPGRFGLGYSPFSGVRSDSPDGRGFGARLSIPLVPVTVVAVSILLGAFTLLIGRAFGGVA